MLHSNRHSKLGPRVGTLPSGIVITTRAAALLLGRSIMSKRRVRMLSEARCAKCAGRTAAAVSRTLGIMGRASQAIAARVSQMAETQMRMARDAAALVREAKQKRGTPHAHGDR